MNDSLEMYNALRKYAAELDAQKFQRFMGSLVKSIHSNPYSNIHTVVLSRDEQYACLKYIQEQLHAHKIMYTYERSSDGKNTHVFHVYMNITFDLETARDIYKPKKPKNPEDPESACKPNKGSRTFEALRYELRKAVKNASSVSYDGWSKYPVPEDRDK